jgi:uncharacterized protein (DUF983 family)
MDSVGVQRLSLERKCRSCQNNYSDEAREDYPALLHEL